jgi:hypothetical protein
MIARPAAEMPRIRDASAMQLRRSMARLHDVVTAQARQNL